MTSPGHYQREKVFIDRGRHKAVRGYFYVGGRRIRRKLCTFAEAGLDANGNPIRDTAREEKRRQRQGRDRLPRPARRPFSGGRSAGRAVAASPRGPGRPRPGPARRRSSSARPGA